MSEGCHADSVYHFVVFVSIVMPFHCHLCVWMYNIPVDITPRVRPQPPHEPMYLNFYVHLCDRDVAEMEQHIRDKVWCREHATLLSQLAENNQRLTEVGPAM